MGLDKSSFFTCVCYIWRPILPHVGCHVGAHVAERIKGTLRGQTFLIKVECGALI